MTAISLIGASLLLAAASASEPPNAGAGVFAQTGYTRAPVVAADKKAAGMPGPAAIWNGAAWWQVLTYCGTMHGVQRTRLELQGAAPTQLEEQETLSKRYYDLAMGRLAADRRITADEAWTSAVEAEDAWWFYSFADRSLNYNLEALTCRFAESRSKAG